jgi:anti-anti-sigma factor
MSERPRRAGEADRPPSSVATDAPALTGNNLGVAGTVTGSTGAAPLTVTVRAESPKNGATEALLVVDAAGEVDLDTAPLLRAALLDAVERRSAVCCDLSDVAFFSAAGVAALVAAYRRARETGAHLTVRGAYGVTARVLKITGTEQLLGEH